MKLTSGKFHRKLKLSKVEKTSSFPLLLPDLSREVRAQSITRSRSFPRVVQIPSRACHVDPRSSRVPLNQARRSPLSLSAFPRKYSLLSFLKFRPKSRIAPDVPQKTSRISRRECRPPLPQRQRTRLSRAFVFSFPFPESAECISRIPLSRRAFRAETSVSSARRRRCRRALSLRSCREFLSERAFRRF